MSKTEYNNGYDFGFPIQNLHSSGKLPSVTSHIRQTLGDMRNEMEVKHVR